MVDNGCSPTLDLIVASASDTEGADWTERRWREALLHMEQCDGCSDVYEELLARPFIEDTLRPSLLKARDARSNENPSLLQRVRKWSGVRFETAREASETPYVLVTAS